jgi:anti-sigma regulatory factor (Ser/Thr protein kinase)
MHKIFYLNKFSQTEIFDLLKDSLCKIKGNESNLDNIKIALGEIIQNIIKHGYSNSIRKNDYIELSYYVSGDRLHFLIIDTAKPIDRHVLQNSFLPSESGKMGINIIKKITCTFNIEPQVRGNKTSFSFILDNKN